MKTITLRLTLEEMSVLNEALKNMDPFPQGRRRRILGKLRADIRTELALAIEEDEMDG